MPTPITPTGIKFPLRRQKLNLFLPIYTDTQYTDIRKRLKGLNFLGKFVKYLLGVLHN